MRNSCNILNFFERLVEVVSWEKLGPQFGVTGIEVAQPSKDDFVRIVGIQHAEIFGCSDIPFVVEEDLVASEAEEGFVFFDFISIEDLSITVALGFEEIGGDVILSLEALVIESHPVGFFLSFLDVDCVRIKHFKS